MIINIMKKFEKMKKIMKIALIQYVNLIDFLEKFNKNYILRKYKYIILKLR